MAGATGTALLLLVAVSAYAQIQVPPGLLNRFNSVVSSRVEATTIIAGDYGVTGASYSRGGDDITVSKFGGGGDIGDPQPLGNLPIGWQPQLQGSMGYLTSGDTFNTAPLTGDKSDYKTFAIQFGGGARFWLNDHLSLAPTFMGMYGHTEESYTANSVFWTTNSFQAAQDAGLVNWDVDTWTARPAGNVQYVFNWGRTVITLSSDFVYFHTDSFHSSSSLLHINGDSETWKNKIDVDIPLGKKLLGHELHTGGFFSRSELYGDVKDGLNSSYLYEAHGRLVLDFLGQLWKVQWIGLGGSYLWGEDDATGWSVGADIAFRF